MNMKMNTQRHASTFMALLLLVAVVLACNLGDETSKANELVKQTNTTVEEYNKLWKEADGQKDKVLTAYDELKEGPDFKADLEGVRKLAREAVAAYDKAAEKCKEVSQKNDETSKLKLNEKFKEYLTAKVKEWNKRAEVVEAAKGIPQALLDSKGHAQFISMIKAAKDKAEKLNKEATDLRDAADKIQKDNPTVIKST
jgi:hypothetical protein